MSRLPRLAPGAGLKDVKEYLNLLAASIDAGGLQNLNSVTATGITGQGLTQTFPATPGSTNPLPGSSGTPTTPTGLQLSYGIDNYNQTHDGFIIISWTPNPVTDNIARYDIYWRKGSDSNLHQLTVGGDVNLARINSVIPGLSYTFAIQAHDTAGRGSAFSMEQSITISLDVDPPATPTGVAATTIGGGIVVTWTEVGSEGISNDLKQYQIAISTDGGVTYPTVRTVGPGNFFLYHPTVTTQATIFFQVATVDWTGNVSAYSTPVSASVGGTIVGPLTINPGGLTVSSGGMTVTGNSTITGNLHVTGTSTLDGDVSTGARLLFSAAISKIVPGTTSLSLRNNADNADNLFIADVGDLTGRTKLTIPGPLILTTAVSQIIPGGTSLSLRNNANNADNFVLTDVGLGTMRNALFMPPSAGGTLAATSYGTVPVKIAEVSLSAIAANIQFLSIPTGFRHLLVHGAVRSDTINASTELKVTFNGNAALVYNAHVLGADGATAITTQIINDPNGEVGIMPVSADVANLMGEFEMLIPNYANASTIKSYKYYGGFFGSGGGRLRHGTGSWGNTAAINSLTFVPVAGNFVAGTVMTLYGIP